jgi:predicted DNA-binding protein (UPF0251 family)
MARPRKKRNIRFNPGVTYFKPRAVPLSDLEEVTLTRDEIESIRLVDFKNKTQEEASKIMNISQSTLQRSLANARFKISDSLINGKAIRVEDVLE